MTNEAHTTGELGAARAQELAWPFTSPRGYGPVTPDAVRPPWPFQSVAECRGWPFGTESSGRVAPPPWWPASAETLDASSEEECCTSCDSRGDGGGECDSSDVEDDSATCWSGGWLLEEGSGHPGQANDEPGFGPSDPDLEPEPDASGEGSGRPSGPMGGSTDPFVAIDTPGLTWRSPFDCPTEWADCGDAPIGETRDLADVQPSTEGVVIAEGLEDDCDVLFLERVWGFLQQNWDLIEWALCMAGASVEEIDCMRQNIEGTSAEGDIVLLPVTVFPSSGAPDCQTPRGKKATAHASPNQRQIEFCMLEEGSLFDTCADLSCRGSLADQLCAIVTFANTLLHELMHFCFPGHGSGGE